MEKEHKKRTHKSKKNELQNQEENIIVTPPSQNEVSKPIQRSKRAKKVVIELAQEVDKLQEEIKLEQEVISKETKTAKRAKKDVNKSELETLKAQQTFQEEEQINQEAKETNLQQAPLEIQKSKKPETKLKQLKRIKDKALAFNIFEYVVNPSQKTTKIQSSYIPLAIILKFVYVLGIIIPYFLSLSVLLFGTIFKDEHGNPAIWVKAMSLTISTIIFFIALIDYIMVYLYKVRSSKRRIFISFLFPFTFKGILLFLIILSTIATPISLFRIGMNSNLDWLKYIKYLSYLRAVRVLLLLSFFTPFKVLYTVIAKEKKTLFYIFLFIIFVILSFSIIFYDVEPSKFNFTTSDVELRSVIENGVELKKYFVAGSDIEATPAPIPFWNAIYFTTVTMTSIGYGDITLITTAGRIAVITLSLMGIAIFAIPSGIIAGGFVSELKQIIEARKENKATEAVGQPYDKSKR